MRSLFLVCFLIFNPLLVAADYKDNKNEIGILQNSIKLVILGKTGAGKSTIINAFYNFVKQVKWNDSKHFPIPTDFHDCNVEEYKPKKVEKYAKNQLQARTQDTSEYVVYGANFVLNLIDCPGMADPNGIEKDLENKIKIANYLRDKTINAICIVLPSSVNRETTEEIYSIEEIKSLIPIKARNRIFILVTHSITKCKSVEEFLQSVDLPTNNLFYFDNYAFSNDGFCESFDKDLNPADSDSEISSPFTDEIPNVDNDDQKIIRKIKETWKASTKQFNRVLRTAKDLGSYTFTEMKYITNSNARLRTFFKAFNTVKNIHPAVKQIRDLHPEKLLNTTHVSAKAYINTQVISLQIENTAQAYQKAVRDLKSMKLDLKHKIIEAYLVLHAICLSSLNLEIPKYLDVYVFCQSKNKSINELERLRKIFNELIGEFKQVCKF